MKISFHHDPGGILWHGVGMGDRTSHDRSWNPYFSLGFLAVDWYGSWKKLIAYFWKWSITIAFKGAGFPDEQ